MCESKNQKGRAISGKADPTGKEKIEQHQKELYQYQGTQAQTQAITYGHRIIAKGMKSSFVFCF